jgi:hypothetical protein
MDDNNRCKRQQYRKLSWLDKDRDKDQSQFDERFN